MSTNLPSHRLGRAKPRIAVEDVMPKMPDLAHLDPDTWLKHSRATPGMTNRILEDRLPDDSNYYQSAPQEMSDHDPTNNQPEVLYRQGYLQAAIFSAVMLAIFFARK